VEENVGSDDDNDDVDMGGGLWKNKKNKKNNRNHKKNKGKKKKTMKRCLKSDCCF
jgi:hypothetical protein